MSSLGFWKSYAQVSRDERGKRDGEKGGRVPFGYVRAADGTITIDENAAAIVRQVFALRVQGKTLMMIADHLNAAGIPTARASSNRYHGAKWYARTVKIVLDNENAYHGGQRGDSPLRWQPLI